jgi:hypothetical protein
MTSALEGGGGASSSAPDNHDVTAQSLPTATTPFEVGQLVSVESRTWPGINQPGGVGRITGVSTNSNNNTTQRAVSVKYVLDGRHEKEIAVQYVKHHSWIATTTTTNKNNASSTLRDRSMLLGRCARCGSLRTDCGSCDVWYRSMPEDEEPQQRRRRRRTTNTRRAKNPSSLQHQRVDDSDDQSDSNSDSSDSIGLEAMLEKHRRDFHKYKRLQAKAKKFFAEANLGFSSESSHGRSSGTAKEVATKPSSCKASKLTSKASAAAKESSSSGDDNDSSSSEGVPLHQLAFQSSQRVQLPRRSCLPLSKRRSAQRRMVRRARNAILESSCSSSDEIVVAAKTHKANADSTPTHRRPRALPVSNPGSPGYEVGGVLAATAAAAAAESPSLHSQETPARNHAVTATDHGDVDEAVQDMTVDGEGDFIQPEGNANELPSDILDATAGLEYDKLAPFFDETIQRLERDDIPASKLQVLQLEREWRDYQNVNADRRTQGEILKQKRYDRIRVWICYLVE